MRAAISDRGKPTSTRDRRPGGTAVRKFDGARAWAASSAFAALALVTGGCAVDDRGMVRVRRFQNATCRAVELDAWGVHVVTRGYDAGVSIGHSRKVYYFARTDTAAPPGPPTTRATQPVAGAVEVAPLPETSEHFSLGQLGDPLVISSRQAGAGVAAHARQVGAHVGISVADGVIVPLTFDGLIVILGDPARPENSHVYIKEMRK